MYNKILNSANYLLDKVGRIPEVAIILGSGLGGLADQATEKIEIDYKDIPNFPTTSVAGHEGKLIFGFLGNHYVVMMKGRFHYYEGNDMDKVTFPIRVFAQLNIKNIVLTNAAGGVGEHLNPGDIMLINDHLSLFVPSVLRGANYDLFGPRFPDMTHVYSQKILGRAREVAKNMHFEVKEGVYSFFSGPRYETPADIRALKTLGVDATGMSTVPEAIVAKHCGMKVLGISLITNKAAGLSSTPLSHNEVMEISKKAGQNMCQFVTACLDCFDYQGQKPYLRREHPRTIKPSR